MTPTTRTTGKSIVTLGMTIVSAVTTIARAADVAPPGGEEKLRLTFRKTGDVPRGIDRIEVKTLDGWRAVAAGVAGAEFSTSLGEADASAGKVTPLPDVGLRLELTASTESFDAS